MQLARCGLEFKKESILNACLTFGNNNNFKLFIRLITYSWRVCYQIFKHDIAKFDSGGKNSSITSNKKQTNIKRLFRKTPLKKNNSYIALCLKNCGRAMQLNIVQGQFI